MIFLKILFCQKMQSSIQAFSESQSFCNNIKNQWPQITIANKIIMKQFDILWELSKMWHRHKVRNAVGKMVLIGLVDVVKSVSHSVVSDSLWPYRLWPARFFCPWNSPSRNTEVGSHSLLQGIFPTQGSNPGLLHCGRVFTIWATREAHLMDGVAINLIFVKTKQNNNNKKPLQYLQSTIKWGMSVYHFTLVK